MFIYNARPLNSLNVAHNSVKAIDEHPDYQVNFEVLLQLEELSTLWNTETSAF